MQLLIVRHAIAVPRGTPDIPDDERPLTAEGERLFRRAARGLARITDRPDEVLTSPLPRARRTAVLACKAWGKVRPESAQVLAGGTFAEIAALLDEYTRVDLLAIFGHEPDVSSLVGRLLGTPHDERLTFRKGGAALLDVPGPLSEGGALLWYASPRLLRTLGR